MVWFLFLEVAIGFEPMNQGFADPRLTTWLCHHIKFDKNRTQETGRILCPVFYGADDEARTRYLHLGKVALYQMSYIRIQIGASDRNRTNDTRIFSPLLYQLSYRGKKWRPGTGSNRRPLAWQASVLTNWTTGPFGGNNRARTCDPLLVRQMLSQLSYAPTFLLLFSAARIIYHIQKDLSTLFFKFF